MGRYQTRRNLTKGDDQVTDVPRQADLRQRALACMPGGVNSNVRLESARWFFERGTGAWLWDTDGHDYVDYALGMGAMFLGHAHPTVATAVEQATRRGMVYGAQHPLEVEAAEAVLNAIGWAERVRLGLTGSEVVHAALRLARAATNREKIVRFTGHYHGWLDNIFIPLDAVTPRPASRGQPASGLEDLYVIPWNEPEKLESLLADHGDEIAAVVMEPVLLRYGSEGAPSGFPAVGTTALHALWHRPGFRRGNYWLSGCSRRRSTTLRSSS